MPCLAEGWGEMALRGLLELVLRADSASTTAPPKMPRQPRHRGGQGIYEEGAPHASHAGEPPLFILCALRW